MKNNNIFFSVIVSFLSITIANSQSNEFQTLIVKNYLVENYVIANDGGASKPFYERKITLTGKPYMDHKIERVVLTFTNQTSTLENKPIYDNSNKTASGWYPLSEFDTYYEMLKHKRGINANYHHSAGSQMGQIYLTINGNVPLQD